MQHNLGLWPSGRYYGQMSPKNRRKHYLVNKPLQFRYVFYIVATLLIVSATSLIGTYYGIWASVVNAFSAHSVQELVTTAAQIHEYQEAREPRPAEGSLSSLRLFKETDLLSDRQKEIIREILDKTNQKLIRLSAILILLIGWASIFLTHKIAGPLYRLRRSCQDIGSGNLTTRLEFRKRDEAHDVARDFNQMAASLDATVSTLKRIVGSMPSDARTEELKKALTRFRATSD